MSNSIWLWVGFNAFVLLMLALDLGVFHRKAHEIRFKEALGWSGFWIGLALVFALGVWRFRGADDATAFLTGYLIEKALSIDNLFVILLIFSYFAVPTVYQHKVLFWGILGALLFRAVFIFAGVALIQRFHATIYLLGTFLILTGIKMAFQKETKVEPEKNRLLRLFRRFVPVTADFQGGAFFTRVAGRIWATPLFVALLFVELTDLVFAVDSIPAILAVLPDPFIVYTANVFAILGLRSLYFALAGMMDKFRYLKPALAVVLIVVGVKMLTAKWLKEYLGEHFNLYLLGTVLGILGVGVVASLVANRREERARRAVAA